MVNGHTWQVNMRGGKTHIKRHNRIPLMTQDVGMLVVSQSLQCKTSILFCCIRQQPPVSFLSFCQVPYTRLGFLLYSLLLWVFTRRAEAWSGDAFVKFCHFQSISSLSFKDRFIYFFALQPYGLGQLWTSLPTYSKILKCFEKPLSFFANLSNFIAFLIF